MTDQAERIYQARMKASFWDGFYTGAFVGGIVVCAFILALPLMDKWI